MQITRIYKTGNKKRRSSPFELIHVFLADSPERPRRPSIGAVEVDGSPIFWREREKELSVCFLLTTFFTSHDADA